MTRSNAFLWARAESVRFCSMVSNSEGLFGCQRSCSCRKAASSASAAEITASAKSRVTDALGRSLACSVTVLKLTANSRRASRTALSPQFDRVARHWSKSAWNWSHSTSMACCSVSNSSTAIKSAADKGIGASGGGFVGRSMGVLSVSTELVHAVTRISATNSEDR